VALFDCDSVGRELGELTLSAPDQDRAAFDQLIAWKREQLQRTGAHDFLAPAWTRQLMDTLWATTEGDFKREISPVTIADRKGEIVVTVGPPGEAPPATAEDADAALREALTRLSVSKAAGEVAKKLGLDRRTLYDRATELKG